MIVTGLHWWSVNISSGNGWNRQATSHYLSQCWPRSLSPYGVTRPQWVEQNTSLYIQYRVILDLLKCDSAVLIDKCTNHITIFKSRYYLKPFKVVTNLVIIFCIISGNYIDIKWASWHLKSLQTWFVWANIKENSWHNVAYICQVYVTYLSICHTCINLMVNVICWCTAYTGYYILVFLAAS